MSQKTIIYFEHLDQSEWFVDVLPNWAYRGVKSNLGCESSKKGCECSASHEYFELLEGKRRSMLRLYLLVGFTYLLSCPISASVFIIIRTFIEDQRCLKTRGGSHLRRRAVSDAFLRGVRQVSQKPTTSLSFSKASLHRQRIGRSPRVRCPQRE